MTIKVEIIQIIKNLIKVWVFQEQKIKLIFLYIKDIKKII